MPFKGVSREEVVPEGKSFRRHRQGQHHLGLLYPVVLAVPGHPQVIRFKAFEIEGGHIEEQQRRLRLKEGRGLPRHDLPHPVRLLRQGVHHAVNPVQRHVRSALVLQPAGHPPLARRIGEGAGEAFLQDFRVPLPPAGYPEDLLETQGGEQALHDFSGPFRHLFQVLHPPEVDPLPVADRPLPRLFVLEEGEPRKRGLLSLLHLQNELPPQFPELGELLLVVGYSHVLENDLGDPFPGADGFDDLDRFSRTEL